MITVRTPFALSTVRPEVSKTLSACVAALREKKAQNILVIDVREWSPMTSYMIIAEGNVERHVQALAREVVDACQDLEIPQARLEGLREGNWVLIDLDEVIIHLFVPEWRERYALERMWVDAPLIPTKQLLEASAEAQGA